MFTKTSQFLFTALVVLTTTSILYGVEGQGAAAQVTDGERYVIPATDGYGIGECLHTASDCGRVMADSWCEAHGHAHALAYGSGDDVTGSTPAGSAMIQLAAGDVVIRCGD